MAPAFSRRGAQLLPASTAQKGNKVRPGLLWVMPRAGADMHRAAQRGSDLC